MTGFRSNAHLAMLVVKWLLYLILTYSCIIGRNMVWWKNGTRRQKQQNTKPDNYAMSAHKMTIIFHFRFGPFIEVRLSDYILMHHSFVNPEYVLRNDVHLIQVTAKEAVFVQLRKGCRGPDEYAFSIFGYNADAKNIITMPMESLNRLADSMGKNDAKIIILQNQARCGGTLFTEVFKATGRCITYNEPHPFNAATKLYYMENKWSRQAMLKNLRSIIRLQCKPKLNLPESTLAYIIKPTAMSMITGELLPEAMPEVIQFFIYRNPVEVGISLRRAGEGIESLRLMFRLPKIPNMHGPMMASIGCCNLAFRGWTPKISQEIEWGYRVAATTMKYYLRFRDDGIPIHGIRYAIFRDNKNTLTEKIFAIAGIPTQLVEKATEAFGRDSQEESPISMEKLKKLIPIPPKATPAVLDALKEMSRDLGVPGTDEWKEKDFILPGSLVP